MKQTEGIWRNHIFVRMFTAYAISIFGVYLDMIAISVLIGYTWKADPILVGLVPVTYALPGILLGSWAGVLADRYQKLNIMIMADLLTAVTTFCLIFVPNVYGLLPLLMVRSVFGVFFYPAQQALTKQAVREQDLMQATSWNGLIDQVGKIVGPMIGAIMIAVVSPQICMIIKAISSLLSALILFSIVKVEKRTEKSIQEVQKAKMSGAWLEGWRYVLQNKIILVTMFYGLLGLAVIQLVDSQFPVLFRELLPQSPEMMGWIISIVGLGGVCGALGVQRVKQLRYGWALGGGLALSGFGFGCIGLFTLTTPIFLGFVVGFMIGVGGGLFFISYNIILQKETEIETVGRVFGIQSALANLALIVAPITGGWLVHLFGVSQVYRWVGSMVLILGLLAILFQRVIWEREKRELQEQEQKETAVS